MYLICIFLHSMHFFTTLWHLFKHFYTFKYHRGAVNFTDQLIGIITLYLILLTWHLHTFSTHRWHHTLCLRWIFIMHRSLMMNHLTIDYTLRVALITSTQYRPSPTYDKYLLWDIIHSRRQNIRVKIIYWIAINWCIISNQSITHAYDGPDWGLLHWLKVLTGALTAVDWRHPE